MNTNHIYTYIKRIIKSVCLFLCLFVMFMHGHDSVSKPANASGIGNTNNFVPEVRNGVYNYCPSYIVDEQPGVYYCANSIPNTIRDNIYYYDINMQQISVVLAPSYNSWDSMHVCDPSVIAGEWYYDNVSYKYLMAYLGCCTTDNQKNQIGLAVSNNKDSGWVKIGEAPLIAHGYDIYHADTFQWGVGQPSLINLGNGYVALFYTDGRWNLTQTKCSIYNLYNLNQPVLIDTSVINNTGLTQADGSTSDFMSNADFALFGSKLYVVCDTHPFGNDILSCIPAISKVYYADIDLNHFMDSLKNCNWREVARVDTTGKNHNCGLARTQYGYLAERSVIYTHAIIKQSFTASLYTYRIKHSRF